MKYIKNILLSCTVVALTSCVNDDVNYTTTDKPTVSMTGQSATSVMEGETITVSLTTDATYKEEMDFKLELVSGGSNSDYIVSDADGEAVGATTVDNGFGAFGYKIEFPAYAENHTFNITAVQDVLKEGTENLRFKLTSADNKNGLAAGGAIFIDLEVTNYVSDELVAVMDFDKTVSYVTIEQKILETDLDDETVDHTDSLCNLIDYDFYLGSWFSWASCPEEISAANAAANPGNTTAPGGPLADGDYVIVADLYEVDLGLDADENEILDGDFALPFTLTINHVGTFNASIDFPATYFSNSPQSAAGGNGQVLLGTLSVVGGKYILKNADDEVVAAE